MLEKYNRYKILKIFFDNPTDNFRLRELSRMSKISPPSVLNYLKEFKEAELIDKYQKRGIPFYKANIDNETFIQYKKLSILFELYHSGLINFLWDKLSPHALILYGSYTKGEASEESDIDIFVIGKERKIELIKFEEIFSRKIHLIFETDIKKIPKELKNNLINGIILKGYFKVF